MNKLGVLLGLVIFGVSALAAGSPPTPSKQKADRVIWAGESGGFKIRWSDNNLQAIPLKSQNRVVFSAHSLAQQEFALFKAAEEKYGFKGRYCEVVCDYKILAVAGSILNLFEGRGVDCENTAHPSETNRFTVIDLKKTGDFSRRRVKLTDYFSESAVYQAFLADRRVQEVLARREAPLLPSPRNLSELYASLKDVLLNDGECSYRIPEDFLTRFAFHHLEGDKVAVRLALPYFGEVCRGQYLEMDLLLPMPAGLKEPLGLAALEKEGFLMQAQERLSGGRETIMRFTKGKQKPGRNNRS
jgi:hypothetical protein